MSPTIFERELASFVEQVTEADAFVDTVHDVVEFACRTIGATAGGVTIVHAGGRRFETFGSTDDDVARADQLQYELSEGPCVRAALEVEPVLSPDIAADERWPRWGPKAADLGFHSVLSVELHGRDQRIGALNLYGQQHRQFSEQDVETAALFSNHASFALYRIRNEETLRQALSTSLSIGQAQGILMERFDLEPDQAFAVLRRYSQHGNIKLHEIAERLVATRDLPAGDS